MNLPKLYLTLTTRIYFLVINPFYILSPDTKFPFVEELKCHMLWHVHLSFWLEDISRRVKAKP